MKNTLFIRKYLLVFLFYTGLSVFTSYAQTVSIATHEKRISLETLFLQIEKQSDYLFFYVDRDVKNINVNVNVENKDVKDVLNQAFKDTNLQFSINDRHINIYTKNTIKQKEEKKISGKVTDIFGEPIIGATVRVSGSGIDNGTITDINGAFSFPISADDKEIVCSYIGCTTISIPLRNKNVLTIILKEDNIALQEVVVTGYGGTQLRSKVTNSIANVDNEQLAIGLFSNPAQALSGAISGVRVIQSSGNPNAIPSIILRGGTNLDGSGSPLILVDGQQRESMADINPEDIESIDVLKDAGATALYGARANNGVILIATKRGKQGRTSINLKAKLGLNYFNSPYQFMNGGDYLYYMRTAIQRSSQIFQSSSGQWVGTTNMASLKGAEAYGTGNIYWADDAKTIPANGNVDSRAFWSPMIYSSDLAFLLD